MTQPPCIHPPALDEALLLQALDGAADGPTAAHLADCPHCREALEALAQADRRLRRGLSGDPCPPRDALAAWADGDLPAAAAAAIDTHAAACAVCRADLAELAAFRDAALAVAGEMDQAVAALRPDRGATAARPSTKGPLAGLRRLLAVFQPPQAMPAALRSRGTVSAVASSFSADDGRVIVSCVVRPDAMPGRYRLNGRAHGLALDRVALRDEAGRPLAAASLDDRGAFQLRDLPAGRHWLRFEGSGLVLELDRPVDLRPAD
jgi:anti-sigma factor RsiW